jgi:hypothetical protein
MSHDPEGLAIALSASAISTHSVLSTARGRTQVLRPMEAPL